LPLNQRCAGVDKTLHFSNACGADYDLSVGLPQVGKSRADKGSAPPYIGVRGNWKPEFPDASSETDGWIGFTPRKDDLSSRTSLQNTIMKQVGNGYVLEYIRLTPPKVNTRGRPLTKLERDQWQRAKGSLTAAYRIAGYSEHARDMLGTKEYDDVQDRWDDHGHRKRWSVAFLITEAWNVVGWPKARDILGPSVAKEKCEQMSGYIKPLDAEDRAKLEHLEITPLAYRSMALRLDITYAVLNRITCVNMGTKPPCFRSIVSCTKISLQSKVFQKRHGYGLLCETVTSSEN